ncbi:MAG TPA: dihydrodipicolinate synthase family protein [Xanthobacteraceae bacterium]|nr:dihydrodipicolinate synthase family protein [Xanthobacteraceae bacterium]
MPFEPGLVHTPPTPFAADRSIDFALYGRMIDFHLRNGAQSLAVPMHVGESVSLTDDERRALIKFAVERAGNVPVIAHVSDAGTGIAAALARFAQNSGAAAVIATTPYYWTPPPAMIAEHFFQIGAAVDIPFFIFNAPEDMAGAKINAALARNLIERLPNFAGVVDSSLDWQFMIELLTEAARLRPDFALLAGTDLMVSASAIGARGTFSPLAVIAPKLTRRLFDLCRAQKLFEARALQEQAAALRQIVKPGGVASLKAAARIMGRDCGHPRPPLLPLDGAAQKKLAAELEAIPELSDEPRGW